MIFRQINGSNDWSFGRGNGSLATGEQAIELNLRTVLQSWVNDCFFDLGAGVDWTNRLGTNQKAQLMREISKVIMQSYGIVNITSSAYQYNSSTRTMQIQFQIETIYSSAFTLTIQQAGGQVAVL